MLNSDKFSEANKHFSKAQSLSAVHEDYNSQYIFSIVVDGKIDSANKLIVRLDPSQKETFLFQFIVVVRACRPTIRRWKEIKEK